MLTYKKTMSVILLVAMLISILSMSGIAFAEDGGEDTGAEGTDLISELDNDQDVIPSDSTEDNEKMSDDIPDPVEESMTDEGTNGSEETGDNELPEETENDSLPENAENDPSSSELPDQNVITSPDEDDEDDEDEENDSGYYLWVGGVQITDDNRGDLPTDSGWAVYDPETNTLTLSNVNITTGCRIGDSEQTANIIGGKDLKIVLAEGSVNRLSGADFGIYLTESGNYTISGKNAVLEIDSNICGIQCGSEPISPDDEAGTWEEETAGIEPSKLRIEDSAVSARGGQFGLWLFGSLEVAGTDSVTFESDQTAVAFTGEVTPEEGLTVTAPENVVSGTVPGEFDALKTFSESSGGVTAKTVVIAPAASAAPATFTIRFVDDNGTTVLFEQNLPYGATPVYQGAAPVKAATAGQTYTFAGWRPAVTAVTGDATYTAEYTTATNQYTIRFLNEDGTVLQISNVGYGGMPVYSGNTPGKAATTQYRYTFAGWTPAVTAVTGDATYRAVFTEAPVTETVTASETTQNVNQYTIQFVDESGSILQSTIVGYGKTPVYSGATPMKAATAQYTYTFAGWTPAVAPVTGSATYKAEFTAAVNRYTITFNLDGGTLDGHAGSITREEEYGGTIVLPEPNREGYTFDYWEGSVYHAGDSYTVTGEHSFTARWKTDTPSEISEQDTGARRGPVLWILALIVVLLAVVAAMIVRKRSKDIEV